MWAEVVRCLEKRMHVWVLGGGRGDCLVVDRLDHRPGRGERRAEVVRNRGDQLPAAGFERPLTLKRLLQLLSHLVKSGGELAYFIRSVAGPPGLEIPLRPTHPGPPRRAPPPR